MQRKPYRRRIKLIKPRLQLQLTFTFVGFSALALLMQFTLFARAMTSAALELPHDGAYLTERMGGLLSDVLVTSLVLFLPLIFAVGVLTTFRFAGPLYRFEVFLRDLIKGERPGDCRIRKGDMLQDFCELLNGATAPMRKGAGPLPVPDPQPDVPSIADSRNAGQAVESTDTR